MVAPHLGSDTQEAAGNAPHARFGRDFLIFWLGQTLSSLGDTVALIALPLLVLQSTGSVTWMGFVAALSGAGQMVGGIAAGPIADRLNRRHVMIACDGARAVLYAVIPLGWWLAGPQPWLIFVVAFLGAMFGMCFSVAYITAIPNLVPRDRVTEANGRLQATAALANIIGPAVAGVIATHAGAAMALGVDSLSFIVSLLSLASIRLRDIRSQHTNTHTGGWLNQMREGLRFLRRQPVLRALTVLIAGFSFLTLAANDLMIFRLARDLHQPDDMIGVIFGLASLGAIAGGLLAAPCRRRWGFGVCYLGGALIEGGVLIGLGATSALTIVVPLMMAFTFCEIFKGVNSIALRQQVTPDRLLGRVTAAFWTINSAPGPIGAALFGALTARTGSGAVFVGIGGGFTLIALCGLLTPAATRAPEAIVHEEYERIE